MQRLPAKGSPLESPKRAYTSRAHRVRDESSTCSNHNKGVAQPSAGNKGKFIETLISLITNKLLLLNAQLRCLILYSIADYGIGQWNEIVAEFQISKNQSPLMSICWEFGLVNF